jgi:VWFA-related protein
MERKHWIPVVTGVVTLLGLTAAAASQVTVPDRPSTPLFRGQQGEPRSSEIAFDPAANTVTMRLSVEDVKGFFVPNLRRDNFAVYEDGVRQTGVRVEVEHAPITLAVLMEMGGRSQALNKVLADDTPSLVRPLLEVLGRNDKLAVFTYDEGLHTLVDFDTPHDKWDAAVSILPKPTFSEANFYDAASAALDRLAALPGRKALLVVSTGIDTFSHATFDDLLTKAVAAKTPVYVVGTGRVARQSILDAGRGPLARVDWKECARQLERLARGSGGRAYIDSSTITASAIYDDIMEHLRVRYVIAYVPSRPAKTAVPRQVEVKLVDPKSDAPLRITDASGRRVTARAIAQASYTPAAASPSAGVGHM